MKKLVLLLMFVIFSFANEFDWAGKVKWAINYNIAKKVAKKENKPIFVDLALTHCPPCRYISANIYTDPTIANYINENFIPVLIIVDKEKTPTEVGQYFSGSTPTLLFLDANGGLIFDRIGALPPKSFLNMLQEVNKFYISKYVNK